MNPRFYLFAITVIIFIFAACKTNNDSANPKVVSDKSASLNKDRFNKQVKQTTFDITKLPKKFNSRAGKIYYKFSGEKEGTVVFYYDNFGNRWAKQENLTTKSKNELKRVSFWDGQEGYRYPLELKFKKAFKLGNTNKLFSTEAFGAFANIQDFDEANISVLENSELIGFDCQVVKFKNSKYINYLWNGIQLKSESKNQTYEAIKFQKIKSIPQKMLQVPEGYKAN